ncbi:MAG: polymer-forming cytoskeletal protein [Defluviitaleaceae bacterium]|nr:polymer-forming cytoskeletal protein [Defluviitaleaceae bacterium]MCL2835262.1 polymer-forming cytoskeletal protein [Defluviitaleaceae bacterium]
MTIFSQKRPKYGEDPNFTPNTIIGEGVTIRGGIIKGANSVMVSGLVFGDINVDGEVIVTETGYVKGDIVSTFAVIAGIVEGNIQLTSYASLKSSASVTGDICCTAINIEDGAVFTGSCNMIVKSGSLAKKLRRINEQAAAMEAWEPPRSSAPVEEEDFEPEADDEPTEIETPFEPAFEPEFDLVFDPAEADEAEETEALELEPELEAADEEPEWMGMEDELPLEAEAGSEHIEPDTETEFAALLKADEEDGDL